MIKPDWKDAPEWANYFAVDADGRGWWYEKKPFRRSEYFSSKEGRTQHARIVDWKKSLEQRPAQ